MPQKEDDLDSSHLRELAAKCRRLASNASDNVTAAALRQMAIEYEGLADRNDQRLPPPQQIIM
jgi:hypothetical protein